VGAGYEYSALESKGVLRSIPKYEKLPVDIPGDYASSQGRISYSRISPSETMKDGSYIWVRLENGEFRYVDRSTMPTGASSHADLAGGSDVVSAGEITVKDGKIIEMNNNSGHYKPPVSALYNAANELYNMGAATSETIITAVKQSNL
jgi:hypothetical protein